MDTFVLLCTIVLCAFVGVLMGGVCLLGFLGLVSRMVTPER
jgi:hypothetical protein